MHRMKNHSHRLEFRVNKEIKAVIERAAELECRTVTDFAIDAMLRAAEAAIGRASARALPARDARRFLQLMTKPPAPTPELRAAMAAWNRNSAAPAKPERSGPRTTSTSVRARSARGRSAARG